MRLTSAPLFPYTAVFAAVLLGGSPGALAMDLPLQPVADVPLGGRTTRLDYESYDPNRHLLFIAHLGDSAIIVFDTQTQRLVSRIADVSNVHGMLVIPELGEVYASATGTNEVIAIDAGARAGIAAFGVAPVTPSCRPPESPCCGAFSNPQFD